MKPGYKQTVVGVIPVGWEAKSLRVVLANGRLGGNYPNQLVETDFPLMKMGNITRSSFDITKVEYIATGTRPDEQHRLVAGDVLFNTRNTLDLVGKVAVWRDELPVAYYNSNLMRFEFKKGEISSSWYVNYALNTISSIRRLRTLATGTTSVAAIYTRDLLNFSIAVPPLPEQSAIATALSDVDALLAAQDTLIKKKRAIKQGAMQELLTGKRRLPGFGGQWVMKRLGEHLKFLRNGTNSRAELRKNGSIKYLHYGDIHASSDAFWNAVVREMPYLPPEKADGLARLEDGDLVFADASEDMTGVAKSVEIFCGKDHQIVPGLHTIAVRFDKSILADGFKANLQFIPDFRNHLLRLVAGTKVYSTNRAHISDCELALPSVEEQVAIAEVLRDMNAEIAVLEAKREKTALLKQGMMQELLTGKTRLI